MAGVVYFTFILELEAFKSCLVTQDNRFAQNPLHAVHRLPAAWDKLWLNRFWLIQNIQFCNFLLVVFTYVHKGAAFASVSMFFKTNHMDFLRLLLLPPWNKVIFFLFGFKDILLLILIVIASRLVIGFYSPHRDFAFHGSSGICNNSDVLAAKRYSAILIEWLSFLPYQIFYLLQVWNYVINILDTICFREKSSVDWEGPIIFQKLL